MRGVLAASDDCIKVLDLDARLVFMSEGGQRVMEVSDFNAIQGCPWPDFWEGQGNAEAREAVRIARAGGKARFRGTASTMAGTVKYWDVQVSAIPGPDGRPEKLLSISRDITDLRNAQDNQQILMQELAHRMKNMLALVHAISSQTFRDGQPLENARGAFASRLVALATAQDVLLDGVHTEADLGKIAAIVRKVHAPERLSRIAFSGPDIVLGPKAAVAFSLVLHELATNAVKYGALSGHAGQVEMAWEWMGDAPNAPLRFRWRETGGPPVSPPEKPGFGSRLIARVLGSSDGMRVDTEYADEGLRFEIDAPRSFLEA
jgi:two-component sensor histidine kinase